MRKLLFIIIFCLTTSLFADFTLSPNSTSQFFAEHLGKEKVVGTFSNMSAKISSPKAINTKKEVITSLLSNKF